MSATGFIAANGGFTSATDAAATVAWYQGGTQRIAPYAESVTFAWQSGPQQWTTTLTYQYNGAGTITIDRVIINTGSASEVSATFTDPPGAETPAVTLADLDSIVVTVTIPTGA